MDNSHSATNSSDNELSKGEDIKKTDTFIKKTSLPHKQQQEINRSLNCKGLQCAEVCDRYPSEEEEDH